MLIRGDEASDRSHPLDSTQTERAVWIREVSAGRWFVWVMSSVFGLLAVLTLWTFSVDAAAGWISLGALAFALLVTAACFRFRVRIDGSGIEARSVLGWPVVRVLAADVEHVAVARIDPLGEYGGWGLRIAPDRTGVVVRAGEGIVVTRRSGRIFGVTVDDAGSGAALLALAAKRARDAGRGRPDARATSTSEFDAPRRPGNARSSEVENDE